MSAHETYLGDGLYASFDGWQVKLRAPRDGGDHSGLPRGRPYPADVFRVYRHSADQETELIEPDVFEAAGFARRFFCCSMHALGWRTCCRRGITTRCE
jgi:hypothetical protein